MSERYPPRISDDTIEMAAVRVEVDGDPTIDAPTDPSPIFNTAITQAPVYDGPLSSLSEEQRTRVGALNMARPLITDKGLMGSSKPPELSDLIRLAQWILDGNEEPLYPYVNGDAIILGPGIFVASEGDVINWQGKNFYAREDDDA